VILQKRIKKAKEYMKTTDKKIYEISQLVGFDDTGYFSRVFRRYYGISPKEYQSGKRGMDEEE
jgi:two-component system response regulator YesN